MEKIKRREREDDDGPRRAKGESDGEEGWEEDGEDDGEEDAESAIGEEDVDEEGCEVWRSFLAAGATPTRKDKTGQDRTGQDDYRPTQSPIPTGLEIHLAGKESCTKIP
ncbi:hypothetical protein TWF506_010590 [Arthrobotrys conoides]|uniref:Uncharacterized protein n=1 Tax=Arthrobotrys conoides TaxID=74498 RepID=A0AAN8RL23_9PEZI